ncbi:MAG TPA: CHAT domain-containing protein, partial [Chloroflexota bacterium]|nr:CHAT domain-containing protein [Chloroflexota bacterium]
APQTPPVPQAPPRPASRNGGEHPLAGSPPPSPTTPPQTVHAVLSAEAPAEIALNEEAIVDVRVELAGEAAAPLAHHIASAVQPAEKITAILSVDAARLKVVGPRKLDLDPPAEGQPSQNAFVVVGLQAGDARILVMFRQGGSDLGTVSFRTTVAQTVASSVPAARGHAEAQPRVPSDDDVLVLLIDEDREGSQVFFRYHAHSPALGWNYKEFRSDVFKAPRSGAGTAALRYVRAIYQQILDRVLLNSEDLQLFQTELRALGADMCRQLLDDDFVREVWTLRSQVSAVQVTTDEPYVPWELLRLQHPDTREIDDKFLSEYGLVRSLKGRSAPRTLHARDWRYLVGTYPFGSQAALGREVEYLTGTLPTRGITPQRIEAGATPLIAALQNPDFDVLHIACHGDTDLKDVERTTLILTDRRTQRGIEPVTVVPATIQAEARLDARKPRLPLVFLNACETGQQAPSLTDWGGWPRAFWEAGAAAFVGTSWSVYEKPAATFAGAFYDSLLAGSTLARAAAAGRAAAKALGDGSWLAYTVYGNPVARLAT